MKLIINATCIDAGRLTGIERYALQISQALSLMDSTVEVVTTKPVTDISFSGMSYPLLLAKKWLGHREFFFRALWDQTLFRYHVAQKKADLIFFPIQDGLIFPPVKQIVTVHDLHYLHLERSIPECRHEIGPIRRYMYLMKMPHILKSSSAVVAVSESTKREIINQFSINPEKIHVIYNGYDEQRFHVINDTKGVLDRFDLKYGEYFLFVGSILRHKNIIRLVYAFAQLAGDVKLVIAGNCKDPEYLLEIKKAAADSGVSDSRLRYFENISDQDLPYLYHGAIASVLPSLHEGFGVPIIEAMACGTPVITSNCSAMPEVAGDAALLVDPYSVECIASAMREIYEKPLCAEAMKIAGLGRAKNFSWSYSANQLYALCRTVSET